MRSLKMCANRTMNIHPRVENIFSHAVALDQNGRLKNVIYCMDTYIYIYNMDLTVLMGFKMDSEMAPFHEPISFEANDYDSKTFEERDERIVFIQKSGPYVREKLCKTPDRTPAQVHAMFGEHMDIWADCPKDMTVSLSKEIIPLLNEDLSHIEFSVIDGKFKIVQRNIFSGSRIEISKASVKKLLKEEYPETFQTIGMRTKDFLALFTFIENLEFCFSEAPDFFVVKSLDPNIKMRAVIGKCKFDELGTIDK